MATPIRIKRSSVSGKRPGLDQVQLGELAFNYYDGHLYSKRDTGNVGIATTVALLTPWVEELNGGEIRYSGIVSATTYEGDGGQLTVGNASDGSLISSGALNTFTTSTKIVDSIDDLNELSFNILRNTAVTDTDFTSVPTAGGSALNVSLNITHAGNANQYAIDWGDGSSDLTTNISESHSYNQPNGGQFSITVTALNTNGVGAGSSYTTVKENYITVYTPDPVVTFDLYRDLIGGSALTGNNLWVKEGDTLYLDNNTTNTSVGAGVTYTVDWGDGSNNDEVDSDTNDGGADATAARLSHQWGATSSSGTSLDTVTLTLNSHTTANPSVIPTSGSEQIKVYDASPSTPNRLDTKTLSNVTSTGSGNPALAHGFTDNTGGSTINAGDSVVRVVDGTAETPILSSFAYNADSGTLSAKVNGIADGAINLSTNDDSGTNGSLVITEERDYQLLDSSGEDVTFDSSIYYPGFAKGFKARVSKSVSSISVGVNSYQLSHSDTGDTNVVEFVKDDLTVSPTVNIGSASLTENVAGTYRYISGIPYYNTGSPSLTLSGVTISNLVGQCYRSLQSSIFEVDSGSNLESTTGEVIPDQNYTYSDIDGTITMLSGGIPKANTGTSSPYAIGNVTIPITSSSVRSIGNIKARSRNVVGGGSFENITSNIQVHTAPQSGISEIAIDVSDSLGNGSLTDDGVRIFDFSAATTNTPQVSNNTNYYTNNPYTESSDPGVVGTKEATLRLGEIQHNVNDYSSYLPAGPDRSGDTGTQYFTFAFRRQSVANFNINITSSTGISGLWIALPGSKIDTTVTVGSDTVGPTSTINGWLDSSLTYAGSGIPGANSGNGGNGSNGCASNSGQVIASGVALSGSYTMTLGTENMSNSFGNVVLVRIALSSGQTVTSLSIT